MLLKLYLQNVRNFVLESISLTDLTTLVQMQWKINFALITKLSCHDNTAVVLCVTICCDWITRTRNTRKWIFHSIWNTTEKSAVKWASMCSNARIHIMTTIPFNTSRSRRNRRPFADDILKCIFLNENEWILSSISLKFVPKVRINNIPPLVQIMAWRRPGDKPLSEPMMVSLLRHICVTWASMS